MTCPICDQKPMNCDCTAKERCQYGEIEDLEAEIARLHAVNDRLRAEIERLRAMVFSPVTLTDEEREAVERASTR